SEAQNTGSPNSWTKLSNPTTRGGRGEMSRALVNASPKASATGTTKNTISSTTAGEAISIPSTVSPRRAFLAVTGRPGRGGDCRGAAVGQAELLGVLDEVLRRRRELEVRPGAVLGRAVLRETPLPGTAADLGAAAHVRRREVRHVGAVLLGDGVRGPRAGV